MEVDSHPTDAHSTAAAMHTAESSTVTDSQQATADNEQTSTASSATESMQEQPHASPETTAIPSHSTTTISLPADLDPPSDTADRPLLQHLSDSHSPHSSLSISTIPLTIFTSSVSETSQPPPSPSAVDGLLSDLDDDDDRKRLYRGRWTPAEDALLKQWVEHYDAKNWKRIAESAFGNTKSDVQCLHRWQKVLKPGLIKGPWTKAEDDQVVALVAKYGVKKWCHTFTHISTDAGSDKHPSHRRLFCLELVC